MMRTMKQLKRSMIAMFLVVCMICSNTLPAFADQAVASTMRLAKTEGTVSVTNKNGRDMGTKADMKLFNGYNLGTEQASYAWIGLDDSKIIKLDAVSEAEIQKKGKDLEVLLNSGNLFFNVTESLKADETLNIRTSTMVTGIRGTCGWVKVLDSWRTEVFILEGSVECWVMDPVTGQAKSVRLGAGQKATFVVYDQMREGDKCDILMGTFGENEIDPFVAVELLNDPDLCNRVGGATGFNIGAIVNGAEERLDAKEQDVNQKNQVVQNQLFNQPNTVKNPVFETSRDDGGQSSGGSGGGSGSGGSSSGGTSGGGNTAIPGEELDPEPEEVDTIELQMPVTAAELNEALQNHNVKLLASKVDDYNTLEVDTTVTVPNRDTADKQVTELAVDEAVTISVNQGCELRINGTLDTEGNIINYGTITNTSMNTLDIAGALENNGEINNTGKIIVAGQKVIDPTNGNYFVNNGYFANSGVIASDQYVFAGGTFEIMASESGCGLYGYELNNDELVLNDTTKVKALALQGGDVKMMAGTFDTVTLDGANGRSSFEMNGGTVETVESSNGLVVLNSGTVTRATLTDSEIQVYGGSITTLRLNGDAVEPEDNSWSVTARIDGGEVDTVHATAAMIELLNGTITELYADGGDIELLGGNIAAAELEEISATENDPGVSVVLSVEGGEVENLNVTGSTVGSAAVILRSGEVTNLTQTGGEVALLGDKTDKIVGFATVYDTQVTIQGGEIGSLVSSIGWTEIQNGKFESITLDGTEASIQNGIITNGVKIIDSNPEDGNYADVFITGGTISADSASAAITVNAVVEPVDEPSPNVRIDKSSINDDITPVVIDGGDKTAILVQSGVVRVDTTGMIETSDGTEEAVESKHTKIKAKSVDDFVRVSSSEDVFAHAYTVYVDEAGEMNEVDLSNASTLYETEGEGYVLKSARESLRSLVDMAEDGDTVAIKKDMVRTEDDTPSIADISVGYDKNVEVVLDLNGHKLAIGEVYVNEGSELTIIDSQSSGLLDCDWFQNNGVMNLNAIDIDVNSIYNMGTMNIEETDITSSTGNSDEESSFYNYGVLTANGGEWSLLNEGGGSWNYGEMTLADVTVDTNHPIYSSSVSEGVSAELNIVGGKITGDADVLIESSDILNISGGAELMKNRIDSIQALLVVSGGTANIGGSGDPVVLSSTSGSGGALICNMYYGAHDVGDGVTWKSTINLENVQIDSGENSAVHLLAGHSLIVGSNVSITSESEYGAIWCDAISDDNNDYIDLGSPIKLNGGTITNSHAEAGVINQHSSDYEEIENWTSYYSTILLASDSNSMATLKSGSTSCSAKNVNELAEEGLITNSYDYDLGSGNGKTEYMTYTPSNALQTSSVSLMSLRPTQNPDAELEGDLIGGDLPEDNEDNLGGSGNDDVIGDSSDDDDDSNNTSSGNIETATGADATEKEDNTETASGGNATGNGEPMTGAPAAIPLAAALLGIWMSMPKEYKRRNRKEC